MLSSPCTATSPSPPRCSLSLAPSARWTRSWEGPPMRCNSRSLCTGCRCRMRGTTGPWKTILFHQFTSRFYAFESIDTFSYCAYWFNTLSLYKFFMCCATSVVRIKCVMYFLISCGLLTFCKKLISPFFSNNFHNCFKWKFYKTDSLLNSSALVLLVFTSNALFVPGWFKSWASPAKIA